MSHDGRLGHSTRRSSRSANDAGYDDASSHLSGHHRQKAVEETLRESEKRLRFALEGANEGLWDWSIDTGDVYFSAAAELMLGYEPGEMERRAGRHVGPEPAPRRHARGPAGDRRTRRRQHAGVRGRVSLPHEAGRLEVAPRPRQGRRAERRRLAAPDDRHSHRHHRAQAGRGNASAADGDSRRDAGPRRDFRPPTSRRCT